MDRLTAVPRTLQFPTRRSVTRPCPMHMPAMRRSAMRRLAVRQPAMWRLAMPVFNSMPAGRGAIAFAGGYSLQAGHAVVVFGGRDAPAATSTTTFFAANAVDPGLPFGLHLSQPSDTMWLLDAEGRVVARFCCGGTDECNLEPASDQSLTRDPDVTGPFTPHRSATGSNGEAFSVGSRVDGSAF